MRKKKGAPPTCEVCKKHPALYEAPLEDGGMWVNICKKCSTFFTIPDFGNIYESESQSGRILLAEIQCPVCDAVNIISGEEPEYTCKCGVKVEV